MDPALFIDDAPGKLVDIDLPDTMVGSAKGDCAFIPDPLPAAFEMPPEIMQLWGDAKTELGRLDGIGRTLADPAILLVPLSRRESLRSSSLEGTFATPEQLINFERDPKKPISAGDEANAWLEVSNYQQALSEGQRLIDDGHPFSAWFIRRLHEQLLTGVRGRDKSPGKFRERQVHVGESRRFNPPPHTFLAQLADEFESSLSAEESQIDPLIRAFLVHYQFETIHPFLDGNGRVGRLLLSLSIYKWAGLSLPWLYLSAYFEKYKADYIDALFNVSAKGDWAGWIAFCLRATIEQARDSIRRIQKLIALRKDYEEMIRDTHAPTRLLAAIPKLFETPIITFAELQAATHVTYPTARGDMEHLVGLGIVEEAASSRHKRLFMAGEIFDIAFAED